jgi:hypothetical protein
MANTSFANLKAYTSPADTDEDYKLANVTVTGTIGYGSLGYFESANVVRPALSGTEYAGVVGLKYSQEIDTLYTEGTTNVPFVLHKPGLVVPIRTLDPGVAKQVGAYMYLGETAGTLSFTGSVGPMTGMADVALFQVDETIGNGDTRAYGRMI